MRLCGNLNSLTHVYYFKGRVRDATHPFSTNTSTLLKYVGHQSTVTLPVSRASCDAWLVISMKLIAFV